MNGNLHQSSHKALYEAYIAASTQASHGPVAYMPQPRGLFPAPHPPPSGPSKQQRTLPVAQTSTLRSYHPVASSTLKRRHREVRAQQAVARVQHARNRLAIVQPTQRTARTCPPMDTRLGANTGCTLPRTTGPVDNINARRERAEGSTSELSEGMLAHQGGSVASNTMSPSSEQMVCLPCKPYYFQCSAISNYLQATSQTMTLATAGMNTGRAGTMVRRGLPSQIVCLGLHDVPLRSCQCYPKGKCPTICPAALQRQCLPEI
jgi:hypothetical protein